MPSTAVLLVPAYASPVLVHRAYVRQWVAAGCTVAMDPAFATTMGDIRAHLCPRSPKPFGETRWTVKEGMMRRWFALTVVLAMVAAGCGSTPSPSPSPAVTATALPTSTATPTPTPAPSPTPSSASASADPFAGQPYTLDLPAGWVAFDPTNPTSKAALDAFGKANPALAPALQAVASNPNLRMAANTLLGDALVVIQLPSQGLPLATIGQSFTAQLQAVPGVTSKPVAKPVSLPAGDALHWDVAISSNKVGGGTVQVDESVYLVADPQTAVVLEFVTPHGGVIPDEATIVKTLRFRP